MVEKLKQLVAVYKDEADTLGQELERKTRAGDDIGCSVVNAKISVVRAHALQLQGIIEGETESWIELLKELRA